MRRELIGCERLELGEIAALRDRLIEEMRKLSTQNAQEIRDAVEDGKRRMARLLQQSTGIVAARS